MRLSQMKVLLNGIFLFAIIALCSCSKINGPYLFWGPENISSLQPRALVPASADELNQVFKVRKSIIFAVEGARGYIRWQDYPRLQELIEKNQWAYLPQRDLAIDPLEANENTSIIELDGNNPTFNDEQLVTNYENAVKLYGEKQVLGVLALRDKNSKRVFKREANDNNEERRNSTTQSPLSEDTDESFIYIADGNKAALYLNSAATLYLDKRNETIKLIEHKKSITFDDQKAKGYGRLNIIFIADSDKLFLRFNFSLSRGTWLMRAVEVEYRDLRTVLPAAGDAYGLPSAPVGFSYRCSSRDLVFTNKKDTLTLSDFQLQPWLGGHTKFDYSYNCVGFFSPAIWSGLLVSAFLGAILIFAIVALMDVRTPNRFESSRSKQLTFTVQE